MLRTVKSIVLGVLAAALATPLFAQSTSGPPDWEDGGASVYLGMRQPSVPRAEAADPAATPRITDYSAALATHHEPVPVVNDTDGRRLPPPTGTRAFGGGELDPQRSGVPGMSQRLLNFGLPIESIYTVLSALAIVIGAFLILAWLLRRGGRKTTSLLPAEVVSVLGRVPLAARHYAELLRVGNKLVLVSLTPAGAEPLTEVTDPLEVDRLSGLCQQHNPLSTTKTFEQVFRQLSSGTSPGELLGNESLPPTLSPLARDYRAHRGSTARD